MAFQRAVVSIVSGNTKVFINEINAVPAVFHERGITKKMTDEAVLVRLDDRPLLQEKFAAIDKKLHESASEVDAKL